MAKKKTNPNEDPAGAVIYDRMPGADVIKKEDAESFKVDMNFETEEGDLNEEAEETETVASGDETDLQESTEEPETEAKAETEEPADDSGEEAVEETLESDNAETARSDDGGVEDEALEEEPVKKKAPMVPKSRLDEVLAKNKVMQKKIQDIEQREAAAQAEAPKYDFSAKETEYQQLVLDGELEQATKMRNDIRQAEKEQMMFEVKKEMGQTVQANQEAQELQAKAKEIESTFPVLDQNSTTFDEGLTQEVMELRDAFMVQGYGAADSLARATEYTLAAKKPELLSTAGDSSLEGNENVVTQEQLQERRQKTTVKKKVAAAKSQPPNMKGEGAGDRGDKPVNLDVLSDDEFMALPEETLRRMRGDFG
jgi:hypothetical protein